MAAFNTSKISEYCWIKIIKQKMKEILTNLGCLWGGRGPVSPLRKKTRVRTIREMLIVDSNTLPVSGVGADQQSQIDRETAAVSPAKQRQIRITDARD